MNLQVFNDIQTLKRRILPDEKVVLFGSQARGDARADSDWDLLVLLDKERISYEDESEYAWPFTKMGWDYGVFISVKVYSTKEWESRTFTPFYKNVVKDGILIV